MEASGDIELLDCRTCGRTFRPDVLRKHEPICVRNSKKKRKIFESGKQRAEGSDIPINKVLRPGEVPRRDPKQAQAEAKTKQWREKHQSLVDSLRAARNYAKAKSEGGPLPPPPPAVIDTSLVQCPYCQRRFNEESSKRHIPFCKDQQAKMTKTIPTSMVGKKTLYKAPLPKSKQQDTSSAPPPSKPTMTNGNISSTSTRPRPSPQSSQPAINRSEVPSVRTNKSNFPAKSTVGRVQASPSVAVGAGGARGSVGGGGTRGAPSTRTPAVTTHLKASQPKASTAGFCHECGNTFALASARFCSECGVRRLTL